MKNLSLLPVIVLLVVSCGNPTEKEASQPSFAKGSRPELNEQTVTAILKDMKSYTDAVARLDQQAVKKLDDEYQGVVFQMQQKPLFLNVYPDTGAGRVIFLMVPKDPVSGANYLLQFAKELPVVNDKTMEVQIRTKDPEKPFTCSMNVQDPAAYMNEYQSHEVVVNYELNKRFYQSGTYDFDALSVPSYRQRGYFFITFDFHKAQVIDKTASLTADCTQ